jgi:hypothetical protein
VSSDLATLLNLHKGETFSLLASTIDGQANAVDVDVVDIFNTGSAGTNDKYVLTTLGLAQSPMNTDSVERFIVLLDSAALTEKVKLRSCSVIKRPLFGWLHCFWRPLPHALQSARRQRQRQRTPRTPRRSSRQVTARVAAV